MSPTSAMSPTKPMVRLCSPTCRADQVTVSPGVEPLQGPGWAPGCWLAIDRWRPLTEVERAGLVAAGPASPQRSILVFDLGTDVVEHAHEHVLPLVSRDPEGDDPARAAAVSELRTRVLTDMGEHCGLRAPADGRADVVVDRPGQRSTAFDHDNGWRMGLHIDDHQKLPLSDRDQARILCAANLGFAERHLQLVARPVADLLARLAGHGVAAPATAEALKDAYLAAFPDEPVHRITLPPGHGYLCNTQNTIHDGATNDEGLPDVSFLAMGELEPA